ncbi:caspase family protein [Caulobacter sp. Root487D2Y]|uniref:caspase family protein n=1 Tax=Caulobacter sp. Root487D2Y TaxID=1736547 RepID=UPI002285F8B4|nr:caspase family protein [Caulobacter sp. Root487D2Y]
MQSGSSAASAASTFLAGRLVRVASAAWLVGLATIWVPTPARAQPATDSEKFAVLVGVDAYPARSPGGEAALKPLKGPGNDVALVRKLLVEQYHFRDDDTHIMTLVGPAATRAAIQRAVEGRLAEAARQYGRRAVIVFYFAGHGSQTFDQDGDESDGRDETIVAYDSRSTAQGDITDDELRHWFEPIRSHTNAITVILDSCHSETGLRAADDLTPRDAPPAQPLPEPASSLPAAEYVGRVLPERKEYAILTAALAGQEAYEGRVGDAVHGEFTWALVQALQQDPDQTYDELRDEIDAALRKRSPRQQPSAEGRTEAIVFGGADQEHDPHVRITRLKDGAISIAAGELQGVRVGGALAIYDAAAVRLRGEHLKIADAVVTRVGIDSAEATVEGAPTRPITLGDKARIVTPFFGLGPDVVNLGALVAETTTPEDAKVLAAAGAELARGRLVRVASTGEPWDIEVRRGCIRGGALEVKTPSSEACASAYYITARGAETPLIGRWAAAGDDAGLELALMIEDATRQARLRAFDNAVSPLKGLVRLELREVIPSQGADGPVFTPVASSTAGAVTHLALGRSFRLVATNDSDRDLYVALIMLGSSGRTELLTENPKGDRLEAGRSVILKAGRGVGPPSGLETYKLIASTSPDVDYRLVDAAFRGSAPASPLAELLQAVAVTGVRGSSRKQPNPDLKSWTTDRADLWILP